MVKLDQMKATTFANSKESFMAWTEFSEEVRIKEDSSILLWSLEKIADAALEILQADPSLENKAVFWQCQRRYESLLQELGDVYFLYMSKLFTGACSDLQYSFTAAIPFHCCHSIQLDQISDLKTFCEKKSLLRATEN